jgi:hypothetical protein
LCGLKSRKKIDGRCRAGENAFFGSKVGRAIEFAFLTRGRHWGNFAVAAAALIAAFDRRSTGNIGLFVPSRWKTGG